MNTELIQTAIEAIERTFHCRISINDDGNSIIPLFDLTTIAHFHEVCRKAKRDMHMDRKCVKVDIKEGLRHAKKIMKPFWKVCPFGILEYVSPVIIQKEVRGLIFCGGFVPRENLDDNALVFPIQHDLTTEKTRTLSDQEFRELPALMSLLTSQISFLVQDHEEQQWLKEQKLTPQGQKEFIEEFINKKFRDSISLSDLAEHLQLNESYLSRRIQVFFQCSFTQMLQRKRLENACILLTNAAYKIKSVSRNSGFRDASYFHRLFMKTYGMTPLEYRRQHQK